VFSKLILEPFFLEKPNDDIVCVARGRSGRICILEKEWQTVLEIIKQNPSESRVQKIYFRRWCDGEHLVSDNFRSEGNFKAGDGKEYKIYAMKGNYLRLYGAIIKFFDVNTFIITKSIMKKQNKMNRNDGEVAARRAGQILMR